MQAYAPACLSRYWRASFGTFGAIFRRFVRGVVACFWYGAQTAAASGAVVALLIRNDTILAFHQNSHLLGHSTLEVICYILVWAAQLLIIQRGMETVRKFQDWAGPAVWIMMLILAIYLVVKAGTFSFGSEIPRDVLSLRKRKMRASRENRGLLQPLPPLRPPGSPISQHSI